MIYYLLAKSLRVYHGDNVCQLVLLPEFFYRPKQYEFRTLLDWIDLIDLKYR